MSKTISVTNITSDASGYRFLKPSVSQDEIIRRKQATVILYGDERDPMIKACKERLERLGRQVEIQLRPQHDTGMGICGEHLCNCTEPCKSFKHHSYKPE